jgi:hypothetical protein
MPSLPTAAFFADVFSTAARQHDQFRADGLRDGFHFTLAEMGLEEFHVRAMHADYSKARLSIPLVHITALTHKDFRHCFGSFPESVLGIYPKQLYSVTYTLSTGIFDRETYCYIHLR